ncbi:MAG: D-alanyl-D-alanine carboxypeptidase family protein, partial [Patescibacteria group bacterium]
TKINPLKYTPMFSRIFIIYLKTPLQAARLWLTENAYKYGFILSYPKQNTYYRFEPWHWRFVGVALATKLHDGNKYFYDLSQREIDQYLVSIFD